MGGGEERKERRDTGQSGEEEGEKNSFGLCREISGMLAREAQARKMLSPPESTSIGREARPRTFQTPTRRSRIRTITAFAAAGAPTGTRAPPSSPGVRRPSGSLRRTSPSSTSPDVCSELSSCCAPLFVPCALGARAPFRSRAPRCVRRPTRSPYMRLRGVSHASPPRFGQCPGGPCQCTSRRAVIYICRGDRAHASCADASSHLAERMAGMP